MTVFLSFRPEDMQNVLYQIPIKMKVYYFYKNDVVINEVDKVLENKD